MKVWEISSVKSIQLNLCKLWLQEIHHKNVSVSGIKEWDIGACKF